MFTKEQLQNARKTDLFEYLIQNHGDLVIREGSYLRLASDKSVNVKRGNNGYYDFSTGVAGNSVDFLVNYLGFTVSDAVTALSGKGRVVKIDTIKKPAARGFIELPPPVKGKFSAVFAYLKSRGIDWEIIKTLCNRNLLYQTPKMNSVVFVNRERDFAEIRSTVCDYHGMAAGSKADSLWYFSPSETERPNKAYVCEGAIDAISLYQIIRENAFYCSIGGVSNQQRINRIKATGIKVILAVDNDKAGEECRNRNSDLESILPVNKDWNEDLARGVCPTCLRST